MRKLRYIFLSSSALLCGGCQLDVLNSKGLVAAHERHWLIVAVLLMLIVVIPSIIMSFVFAWRYRASNTRATYKPNWSHNTWVEIACWAVPCVIIGVLATITWFSTHELDPYHPLQVEAKKKPIVIQAIALNWKWLFIYPKQHIAAVNYIQIPVNRPIKFLITADAPMNSLEIPQLAGQIYAMTGMRTKLHLIANEPGEFGGLSTNYSGDGFATMRFKVKATSLQRYQQWVREVQRAQQPLTQAVYDQLAKPSDNNPVTLYSSVKPNLFNGVIMKYMGPSMMHMMTDEQQADTEKSSSESQTLIKPIHHTEPSMQHDHV